MAAFTHAVNVFLYGSLGYDPVTDFAPVTLLSEQPCVMIVSNASPVHSVAEFIAFAKANPGKMTYASAGYGTSPHLCGELFKRMTGIEMKHVPYRAGAQQDLIAGHVDVMFAVAPFGLLQAGQVRGLAVTTANRIKAAPDLPTLAECGLQDFDVAPWWGFLVPARTSAAVIRKLYTDTVTVLGEPKVRQKMESLGSTVVGSSPEQFSMRLKTEMAKWGPIIRDAHITIND